MSQSQKPYEGILLVPIEPIELKGLRGHLDSRAFRRTVDGPTDEANLPTVGELADNISRQASANVRALEEHSAACRHNRDECRRVSLERNERLVALATHYGLDLDSPNAWRSLATMLAEDHVPGMKFKKVKTKPIIWSFEENILLVYRVNEVMKKQQKRSAPAACKTVRNKYSNYYNDVSEGTLIRHYKRVIKEDSISNLLRADENLKAMGVNHVSHIKSRAEFFLKNKGRIP